MWSHCVAFVDVMVGSVMIATMAQIVTADDITIYRGKKRFQKTRTNLKLLLAIIEQL